MTDIESAGAAMAAPGNEDARPLPEGDYAIVEVLGHRTMVGRISDVERFGTKLCGIEPIFAGELLPQVLVGGSSIYQLTPCTAEVARARAPKERWQIPASVAATLAPASLPAPAPEGSYRVVDVDEDSDDDRMPF